jgi:hypothetical protein
MKAKPAKTIGWLLIFIGRMLFISLTAVTSSLIRVQWQDGFFLSLLSEF